MSDDVRPIQIVAPGLLGMLGVKAMGSNPDLLRGSMQPTIDLREWLMVQSRVSVRATRNRGPGVTSTQFLSMDTPAAALTVPSGQWWYVWNHSVIVPLVATDVIQGCLTCAAEVVPGSGYAQLATYPFSFTATGTCALLAGAEPRRWFGPGTSFGIGLSYVNLSAALTIVTQVEYTPLPV